MKRFLLVAVPMGVALLAASPSIVGLALRVRDSNPVVDGLEEAREEGCMNCHLPLGGTPIRNPGSQWGAVPVWGGGVLMMYVTSEAEIVEYIRKGLPARKRADPEAARAYEAQLIRMPAFEGRVSDGEILSLAALAKALSGYGAPEGKAGEGYALAVEQGCFACHGPAGYGGMPNAGSVAGVVAGWAGPGFRDLVRSKEEFGEWVRTGTSKRIEANPVARFFLRRQRVQMPAYEKVLSAEQIDSVFEYVQWLRTGPGFTEVRQAGGE